MSDALSFNKGDILFVLPILGKKSIKKFPKSNIFKAMFVRAGEDGFEGELEVFDVESLDSNPFQYQIYGFQISEIYRKDPNIELRGMQVKLPEAPKKESSDGI